MGMRACALKNISLIFCCHNYDITNYIYIYFLKYSGGLQCCLQNKTACKLDFMIMSMHFHYGDPGGIKHLAVLLLSRLQYCCKTKRFFALGFPRLDCVYAFFTT